MSTYRQFVFSVMKDLNQVFDDKKLTVPQVLYWTVVGVNRLRGKTVEKLTSFGSIAGSGKYLQEFKDVPVSTDSNGVHSVELPSGVYALPYEAGIEYLAYNHETKCCDGPSWAWTTFTPTTPRQMKRIVMSKYEKPSLKNPYYYRTEDTVVLLGTECTSVTTVQMGLYIAIDLADICDLDTDMPIDSTQEQILKYELLNLGRFLLLLPMDRENDGSDSITDRLKSMNISTAKPIEGEGNEQ